MIYFDVSLLFIYFYYIIYLLFLYEIFFQVLAHGCSYLWTYTIWTARRGFICFGYYFPTRFHLYSLTCESNSLRYSQADHIPYKVAHTRTPWICDINFCSISHGWIRYWSHAQRMATNNHHCSRYGCDLCNYGIVTLVIPLLRRDSWLWLHRFRLPSTERTYFILGFFSR